MAKKKNAQKKVESIRHKDKRANIPTEELRDFVVDEELAPKTMLYPRDPSLDPQLIWKGKDQQDREDLAVPVVPVYIQEKIHPQAIIDALPRTEHTGDGQANFFADFNGLEDDFEKKVDFYSQKDDRQKPWSNRLILGDSLLVMTSLAEKEGLKGKVQTIYVDPPYGIKFGSNWQVSTRKRDVKDGSAQDATRQPEQVRAFRDTWNLGIHSYLAYLRDRLVVARDLLTETGSVFVQIGDDNVHLVRSVMDEVFGADNFVCQIAFATTGGQSAELLGNVFDFLVWYAKDKGNAKYRQLFQNKELREGGGWAHARAEFEDGTRANIGVPEVRKLLKEGKRIRPYSLDGIASQGTTASSSGPFEFNGRIFNLPHNSHWKTNPEGMKRLVWANRIEASKNSIRFVRFLDDFPVQPITNIWEDTNRPGYIDQKLYVVQTTVKVVERCLLMTTDPGDLVFDPTCGSGSTAFVAEQWGRRWITCDTSRVALALARTRLMTARFPYYLLADSSEGIKREAALTGKVPPEYKTHEDIRKGFVYKRVLHVTLKSIANNPDIKEGMTRKQIDGAIARHANTETLYDQPYEDRKRMRVCGPLSVESLSPHRVLSTADENQDGAVCEQEGRKQQHFATMILENLKKAGVQNSRKSERLRFDHLEPYAGTWLHATGDCMDSNGKSRRVAVSIGPEHGTVGPHQVKEAAKEAVQGVGFDMLVVCGFAFDPHVAVEVKRYGNLTVLPAKMNPDLVMGDELLKKTGAGNLFMVFGEPDVEIMKQNNGQIMVEIKGVDVYDPTTGQIRHASTDDIACWFVDSNYNGESFFVRHAYFTGSEEPYRKLKRALRAQIDEAAWSSLYRTVSQPFDNPETGKFAVKVINHYGDEVLKVFEI